MPIAARRRISRSAGGMLLAAAVVGGGIGLGSATMVFAAPRYVAVCPTGAEGGCATISAEQTGAADVGTDTAVVALGGGRAGTSLTISNNDVTGSVQLTIVGSFDAADPSASSEFAAADASAKLTVLLDAGESRDVDLPGLPDRARSVLVKLTSGGTAAAGTGAGVARVDVATGAAAVTPDEVRTALLKLRQATGSVSPSPSPTADEKDGAPQIEQIIEEVIAETSHPVGPEDVAGETSRGGESRQEERTAKQKQKSEDERTAEPKQKASSAAEPPSAPKPSAAANTPAATAPDPKPAAAAPQPPAQPSTSHPGGGTTGVPAGTSLSTVQGDIVVTVAGTVIDSKKIHGRVIVKAPNVTIRNSIIRGADAGSRNGLIDATAAHGGLLVVDTEIFAANPNPYVNGIMGHDFELRRVNIHSVIDQVHLTGGNVTIADSRLHSNLHYDDDPNHSDGSHDDSIQVQAGNGIRIHGNTISGAHNAAIMVTQDRGAVSNLSISGNTIDGGACTINIAEKSHGPLRGTSIVDNTFGRSTRHADCAVLAPSSTPVNLTGNVYTDGEPVTIRKG